MQVNTGSRQFQSYIKSTFKYQNLNEYLIYNENNDEHENIGLKMI